MNNLFKKILMIFLIVGAIAALIFGGAAMLLPKEKAPLSEPGALLLFGLGILILGTWGRRLLDRKDP